MKHGISPGVLIDLSLAAGEPIVSAWAFAVDDRSLPLANYGELRKCVTPIPYEPVVPAKAGIQNEKPGSPPSRGRRTFVT
jgi:hypothetical protein